MVNSALATATLCACPSDRPTPRSPSTASYPMSSTTAVKHAASTAAWISSSVAESVNIVRLSRSVPENRVFPCGTYANSARVPLEAGTSRSPARNSMRPFVGL